MIFFFFQDGCNISRGICIFESGLGFSTRSGVGQLSGFRSLFLWQIICDVADYVWRILHKARPVDSISGLDRARFRMTVSVIPQKKKTAGTVFVKFGSLF